MNSPVAAAPLLLGGLTPFGTGGRRFCFVHPCDPAKCVKVLRQDVGRTVRLKKKQRLLPAWFLRQYDNNAHEKSVLEALERRIGLEMSRHLPRSYGMVATDMGPGLVLDLIRDADGHISRSIRELITSKVELAVVRPAFEEFSEFLMQHLILTRQLLDHNLVAQARADGSWRLYLIDGLGDPAWLPLSHLISPLARARIRRNIASAWPRFESFAATGGVTEEMRRNSTWGQGLLDHRG